MKTLLTLAILCLALRAGAQITNQPSHLQSFVQISRVLMKVSFDQGRYRSPDQLIQEWLAVDTSKCPADFQVAWLSFMREWEGNRKKVQAHTSKVFVDEAGALLLMHTGVMVPEAKELAQAGLNESQQRPNLDHTAQDNLEAVIKSYEAD
jgi:hypothetical protein